MAAVNLLFQEGLADTDLLFGAVESGNENLLPLGGASTLPAPILAAPLLVGPLPLGSAALLAAPQGPIVLTYDVAVHRGPGHYPRLPQQDARRLSRGMALPYQQAAILAQGVRLPARAGQALDRDQSSPWQTPSRDRRPGAALPWGAGERRSPRYDFSWQSMLAHLRPASALPFSAAVGHSAQRVASGWHPLERHLRPQIVVPWGEGVHLSTFLDSPFQVGRPVLRALRIPWGLAWLPRHGISPDPPDPPGPGAGYVPPPGDQVHLLFDESAPVTTHLLFGGPHLYRPRARVIIPIQRSYLVVNEVTLIRTDNNLALPALSLSLEIDVDTWVWGWQASLPASSLDDVLPAAPGAPVELEATVNGVNFLLLAEKVTRERSFASGRITVSGRGIAAELGDPYAAAVSRTNTTDKTAQQLANAALTVNNVPIGWTVDWQLTDWLVPAGVWSHTGSHIDAVTRIAEAAGGYVQAAPATRTLIVRHRYPIVPWDWPLQTPDFSLPSAVTLRESVEWLERPAYNAVYVSGEGAGVLARVRRAGTAGDFVAPMVTDQLNTASQAASQRGRAILADTGPQIRLTLETPILPAVGLYPVGSLVEFTDNGTSKMGLVRSLSIQAAFPRVRQTIEVDCRE
jgi:hypothetical protein